MRKSSTRLSPFALAIIAVMLLSAIFLGLRSVLSPAPSGAPGVSTASANADVQILVSRIGRHIVINTDEQPTVATVNDAELLRRQNAQFYRDAQNGDRLVIWSDKAVLYSTERDILLAVAPVSLPAASVSTTSSGQK